MTKWLFRSFDLETFEKTKLPENNVSLLLKHPRQWNKGKFDLRCGLINNVEILEKAPAKIGVTDPFEGYLFEEYGWPPDNRKIAIRINGTVDKHIRAICFSSIVAEEDEIVSRIEEEVTKREYGNYYMYFRLDGWVLDNLALSAAQINRTTGAAGVTVVTASYFFPEKDKNIIGSCVFYPRFAAGGGTAPYGSFDKIEGAVSGGIDKDGQEIALQAFSKAIPRKYGPVYKVEDEYRLLIYLPDDQLDEVEPLNFVNANNEVKFGCSRSC